MSDWIRVSCASLCRIEHQGRYLLLLNANRRARGIYVLAAIGGALTVNSVDTLRQFEAKQDIPGSRDLRFSLPLAQLPRFRRWFYAREGRENSPYRELSEELVDETGLLPLLDPLDVQWRLLWTVEDEQFTLRSGQTGLLTHYMLEVYDIIFSEPICEQLLNVSPDTGAVWVDRQRILTQDTITLDVDGAVRTARLNARILLSPPRQRNSMAHEPD